MRSTPLVQLLKAGAILSRSVSVWSWSGIAFASEMLVRIALWECKIVFLAKYQLSSADAIASPFGWGSIHVLSPENRPQRPKFTGRSREARHPLNRQRKVNLKNRCDLQMIKIQNDCNRLKESNN